VIVDPVAFALIVVIGTTATHREGADMLDLRQGLQRHQVSPDKGNLWMFRM
jgi:hypothetical protein